jgi:hypothetical protein
MTESQINRQIANAAARGVYIYSHHPELSDNLSARLLAEANDVDRYYCTDDEMIVMANAEYRKLRGNTLGGFISGGRKRRASRIAL